MVVGDAVHLKHFVDAELLQRLYHVPVGQVPGHRYVSVGLTKSQVWNMKFSVMLLILFPG